LTLGLLTTRGDAEGGRWSLVLTLAISIAPIERNGAGWVLLAGNEAFAMTSLPQGCALSRFVELSENECIKFLAEQTVGRIGFMTALMKSMIQDARGRAS